MFLVKMVFFTSQFLFAYTVSITIRVMDLAVTVNRVVKIFPVTNKYFALGCKK